MKYYGFFYGTSKGISKQIPGTTFYDDISDLDLLTMEYTEKEFREQLRQTYPSLEKDLEKADLFLARIETDANSSYHDFHFYDPLFYPERNFSFDHTLFSEFYELATIRSNRVQEDKRRQKRGKLRFDSDDAHLLVVSRMLIQNILSNTTKKNYFLSSQSITNPKLKEYFYQIKTVNQEKYFFPKILEKLRSYKELRGILLEFYQVNLPQREGFKEKDRRRMNYQYSSLLLGYSPFDFYVTLTEANADPKKTCIPKDVYQEISDFKPEKRR